MNNQRITGMIMVFIWVIVLSVSVMGAGITLTADMGNYGPLLEGAELSLYLVGSDTPEGIVSVGDFADCGISLNEENLPYGAELLGDYVRKKGLEGTVRRVSSEGTVSYDSILPGIYLLMQLERTPDDVTVIPFLIQIREEERAVTAYPKVTVPNVTQAPDLPQTGSLKWPIPVFLSVGVLFLMGGIWLRTQNVDN